MRGSAGSITDFRKGTTVLGDSFRSEEYQRIVQGLLGLSEKDRSQVILVVSAVQGEGTSTAARDLAKMLSQSGSTLLVDANLRNPSQHQAFGVNRSPGLSDVALQTAELDAAIENGAVPGLFLLACGKPEESPATLLSTRALKEVVNDLRRKFDRILIDGPPVTLYSDAVPLPNLSDGVILVARAERTHWEVAEQAKRILEESGGRILGAVLNRRRFHIPDLIYRFL